jgi:hypothetical protein
MWWCLSFVSLSGWGLCGRSSTQRARPRGRGTHEPGSSPAFLLLQFLILMGGSGVFFRSLRVWCRAGRGGTSRERWVSSHLGTRGRRLDNRCLLKSVQDPVGLHLLQGPGQGPQARKQGTTKLHLWKAEPNRRTRCQRFSPVHWPLQRGGILVDGPFCVPVLSFGLCLDFWAGPPNRERGRRLSRDGTQNTTNFEFDQGSPLFCFPAAGAPRPAVPSPRARRRRLPFEEGPRTFYSPLPQLSQPGSPVRQSHRIVSPPPGGCDAPLM